MYGKALSYREADKVLKKNGYDLVRNGGEHLIYKNAIGETIALTRQKISQKTWKRECKKHNIKLEV